MIETHLVEFFNELKELVRNGISLMANRKMERFNIVCFFVADLCFVKDVIGQCQCTSLYGCYHCMLKNTDWISVEKKTGKPKNMKAMTENGLKAVCVLGENPDRGKSSFTNFQQSHGGQWVTFHF